MIFLKFVKVDIFFCPEMCGMATSVEPDQTAPKEQSDQRLLCLLMHVCPNIWGQ